MTNASDRRREPKGIPTGGQFAPENKGGADISDLGEAGYMGVPLPPRPSAIPGMPPLPERPRTEPAERPKTQESPDMPPLPPRVRTDYADPFDDYDAQTDDTARANWLATHLRRGDPGSVDLAVHAIVHHPGRPSETMVDAVIGSGCVRRSDGSVDASAARRVAHVIEARSAPTVDQELSMVGWYEPGVPGAGQAAAEVLDNTRDPGAAEAAFATAAIADGSADGWYARLLRNPSYPGNRTAGQARRSMMAAAPVAYGLMPDGEAERRIDSIADGMARRGLVRRQGA